jgi:hypothetical protein
MSKLYRTARRARPFATRPIDRYPILLKDMPKLGVSGNTGSR